MVEQTTLSVKPETRDRVRSLKREGITYDELINRMADAYDPDRTSR